MLQERGVDRLPIRGRQIFLRHWQHYVFFRPHVLPVKGGIGLRRRCERGELGRAAELISHQRALERSDLVCAHPMLVLKAIQQRRRIGLANAQNPEKVVVLLGVVEAFGECIDVIDHGPEQLEVRLGAIVAYLANQIEHAVQYRRD